MRGSSIINMQKCWLNLKTTHCGGSFPWGKILHNLWGLWGLMGRTFGKEILAQMQIWFWYFSSGRFFACWTLSFLRHKMGTNRLSRGGGAGKWYTEKDLPHCLMHCRYKAILSLPGVNERFGPNKFNLCCLFSPYRPVAYSWVIQTSPL